MSRKRRVLKLLFASETIPEAARRWGWHENTIRAAMVAGKLDCRLAGGVWLITVESLVALWGEPGYSARSELAMKHRSCAS